jgi:hypothetical protein
MRIAASIFGLLFLGLRIASAADELFLSQDGKVSPATGDEWRITPALWGNGGKLWLKLGPEIPKAGSSVQNVNTGSAPTTPDATAKLPAGGK